MKYQIFVIGAGGTGSYFLKEFSRYIAGDREKVQVLNLHIFDGDVVEAKNIARQSFQMEDCGRNKAAVMAEVLEDAFSVQYTAHAAYLLETEQIKKHLKSEFRKEKCVPVIIGCVDNHAARMCVEALFDELDDCIVFDSANEFSNGEVVFAYKSNGTVYGPCRSHYFPDIKEGDLRAVTEMSCEELNAVAPQHIFTNMLAANILLNAVTNLFDEVLTPGFVYFNGRGYSCDFVAYQPLEKEKEEMAAGSKGKGKRKRGSKKE